MEAMFSLRQELKEKTSTTTVNNFVQPLLLDNKTSPAAFCLLFREESLSTIISLATTMPLKSGLYGTLQAARKKSKD
eukprot:scaffold20960_cov19-Tisochrysis_lutea.AAC.4